MIRTLCREVMTAPVVTAGQSMPFPALVAHHVQPAKLAHGEVPRGLTETEAEELRIFGAE